MSVLNNSNLERSNIIHITRVEYKELLLINMKNEGRGGCDVM